MGDLGIGAGLAALAFWGFVAVAVLAATWNGIRKREAQHETVRRLIESGQTIDPALMDRLMTLGGGGSSSNRPDREFRVTALWMLPISVGLGVFAAILGTFVPEAFTPILGAAAMLFCMGLGWLIAAKVASRWYADDEEPARGQLGA